MKKVLFSVISLVLAFLASAGVQSCSSSSYESPLTGQNVSDIFRYSSMEDHLEILEWTLQVRHISPTAPDTLGNGACLDT